MDLKVIEGSAHNKRYPIVAIDGPAGAGKSTAARLLASMLRFTLIDTGALYRSLALRALEDGIPLDDSKALANLARNLEFQFGSLQWHHGDQNSDQILPPKLHVYCNGVDVSDQIRTPELGIAASKVSKLPEVRDALLDFQRAYGKRGGIVMEGRDIGTVIFPDAELKFYLTASVESRAKRRWEELKLAGVDSTLDQVIRETQARDDQDMSRAVAPLKKAEDAILIDSTQRSLLEVVHEMFHFVRQYLKTHELPERELSR